MLFFFRDVNNPKLKILESVIKFVEKFFLLSQRIYLRCLSFILQLELSHIQNFPKPKEVLYMNILFEYNFKTLIKLNIIKEELMKW